MRRFVWPTFAILLCSSLCASAQNDGITLKATEVAEGLIMLQGEGGFTGGNISLSVGDDGVILIDGGLENYTQMLLDAIAVHTDNPVDYVINTHVHGDHIGANAALFLSGATVVAHDNIRTRLLDSGWQTRDGKRPATVGELPQITFSDAMTFHLNGRTAKVIHLASGHTDGDAIVHYAELNVLHAGDYFFNGLFPFVDLDSGGSVAGFIAGMEKILSLSDEHTKIVPGHGPLAGKADLQRAVDMLKDADTRIAALIENGRTAEEIRAENPLADYHDDWNWSFITTEVMTDTLIRSNSN